VVRGVSPSNNVTYLSEPKFVITKSLLCLRIEGNCVRLRAKLTLWGLRLFILVTGLINGALVLLSLAGLYAQFSTIRQRKARPDVESTELLSLNQSLVSYFAYLSFFIYGFSLTPFNHYLVWPRLAASVLTLAIIYEIWLERRSFRSSSLFAISALFFVGSLVLMLVGIEVNDSAKDISTTLIVVITLFLAQAYAHQIWLIVKSGQTGAIDIRLSQSILLKDFSTLLFAIAMGALEHWPLMFLATVSAITKLIIMYLFYWVRTSDSAHRKRQEKLV